MPNPESALTAAEITRYSRHLLMPQVGAPGQQKLKTARVVCVGVGGLGSPVSMYLAAAGVGTLGIVDCDTVDVTNLHRQVLYGTPDIGRPKLEAASERLRALNPGDRVGLHDGPLTSANALDVLARYDIVVDGTDNFPTRYLLSDACVLLGQPVRLRQRLPARRAGVGLRGAGRTVLQVSLSGAPGPGASCRAARRPACSASCLASSDDSGDRGDQAGYSACPARWPGAFSWSTRSACGFVRCASNRDPDVPGMRGRRRPSAA